MSEASDGVCDVCLRPNLDGVDLNPFDGQTCAEIEQTIGPRCWSRASGPCVSLGQRRVRDLEALIRSAIDERHLEMGPQRGADK